MRLTSPQLETLRTRPQQTSLFMSIFQPRTVFQAQINDSNIDQGARTIPYDTVSFGNISAVEAGMTLLIGSVPGGQDVGKIRIRSVNGSQFTVSENSNIAWADNLYLTVIRLWELWPVYPRIVQNPSNDEDVIFYKDYDIPYTNQNSVLGTFVNAGPHRAIFTGEQAYYSSTGTFSLRGASLSYNWAFEGGSPSGSTSADPGYVTYNTPGHYVTRLTISGSNGSIDTAYRYVSVYDQIGAGANPPILKWEVTSLSGSRDEGGHKATFKVYEDIDIQENSVVVLFMDNWYGNTRQSFGGNYPNAEKIFFVGYILENSIYHDYQHSYVEFSAASLTELMKESLGFSVSVESVANPDVWYELLDLDCRRAIYHYLKWHTTALSIADFQFVGEDRKIQFFDADRNSMYDAIDNLMRNTLIGKSVSDRQGKIWMEVDAKATPNPTGSFPSTMEITRRDWMGMPSIRERLSDDLSYLELGGIAYSGVVTGTFSAILSSAPGNTPSFRGSVETREGLALLGQTQLNELAGNIWANENSDYPEVDVELGITATNLDIAPQESVQVIIRPEDTVRGVNLDGLYLPDSLEWNYDPKNGMLLARAGLKNLVSGNPGETIAMAVSADDAGFNNGFNVPGLQIPPLPPLAFPSSQTTGSSCCDALASMGFGLGVYSGMFTRLAATPLPVPGNPPNDQLWFDWEYASNPSMYDAGTGDIKFLNTGTLSSYVFSLTGRWTVTAWEDDGGLWDGSLIYLQLSPYGMPGYNLLSFLSTGLLFFTLAHDSSAGIPSASAGSAIGIGVGAQGNFSISRTFTSSTSYRAPNIVHARVSANVNPATGFQAVFDQLRLTITGTP